MGKITRATQLIFGSSAGANNIAEFGSFAAGAPQRYSGSTITPAIVQTLSNYLTGWLTAVVGANSPAIEDMNALCYLYAYQLAYILQEGVPEYDSATIYWIGSMCQFNGKIYVCKVNGNSGNDPTSHANWYAYGGQQRYVASAEVALVTDDVVRLDPSGGTFIETLPPVATTPVGCLIRFKNIATNGTAVTLKGNAAELIDGANTLVINSTPILESITVSNNGVSWDIL